MKRALYLGRFQMFHLGHLDVLQHIDAAGDVGEIAVTIGSTQYDWRNKSPAWPWANNPFTYEERREMVVRSLEGVVRKPWSVFGVPDTHEHESWFAGLCAAVGEFSCLYSSDPEERSFFGAHGKEARDFPRKYRFHAGSVRRRVADGVDVRPFIPAGTQAVLERLDLRARMEALYALDGGRSLISGQRGDR
jgi:nicotinamide-nucleotide adenylyltransferase